MLFRLFAAYLIVLSSLFLGTSYAVHAAPAKNGDSFMFVAYGDTRSDAAAHAKCVSSIVALKPEFVIQSGDLVDHGDNAQEWTQFDQIEAPIRAAHIAYYPARGNHDIGPYYLKRVTEKYDSGNGYYYAFTRHGIKFLALDNFEPYDEGSDQYAWLIAELKASHKTGQTVIPFFHESPFSVGPHGSNFDVQEKLHPIFAKYHVPLVFAGHDHLYYRTIRDGVTYIVTGGGGAPLYQPVNSQYAIPGDIYKSVHHIVRCDVTPTAIKLTAVDTDGNIIDKLSVKR